MFRLDYHKHECGFVYCNQFATIVSGSIPLNNESNPFVQLILSNQILMLNDRIVRETWGLLEWNLFLLLKLFLAWPVPGVLNGITCCQLLHNHFAQLMLHNNCVSPLLCLQFRCICVTGTQEAQCVVCCMSTACTCNTKTACCLCVCVCVLSPCKPPAIATTQR